MRRFARAALGALTLSQGLTKEAAADPSEAAPSKAAPSGGPRRPRPRSLSFQPAVAVPVAAVAALGYGAWIGLTVAGAPAGCGWCTKDTTDLDRDVRRALGKQGGGALGRPDSIAGPISDGLLVAQLFVPFFHLAGSAGEVGKVDGEVLRNWGLDTAVMLEAAGVTIGINELVKQTVARERPYVQTLAPGHAYSKDHYVSFFSGHTSTTFVMGVSSAMIATLRGYRYAPLYWGTGLGVAALTGWLRIANDSHWTTDVLTGALVGSAVGVAVPLLHHPSLGARSAVKGLYGAPVAGGGMTAGVVGAF